MTDAQANGLQVGLIGLGKMGRGIGRNLIKNGYPPAVADIDVEPVAELVSWGARDPGGVSELLADSDIVITCLLTPAANRTAYLGVDGFVALAKEGSVLVDCSTSDPLLAREIGIAAWHMSTRPCCGPPSTPGKKPCILSSVGRMKIWHACARCLKPSPKQSCPSAASATVTPSRLSTTPSTSA
ncbi:MAG: hypothetical protein CL569_12075 [Alphaproteobacteria bacterium]|nr:hypothetical protein [Alphaproteobacteria bacterium]